eukprot:gnl/TRDRNA2_/TRDRNA2_163868_c0_seq8.p1 gnl/TRDRNA2_/TRDRNA2_163868_c0~~gnl/TRDRNA2_/TRDRNA2_163868_c0_seq8.p1  ORF type:complete len:105 (+),score=10.49 gnl/TRDRNA2_/TRDRNA2_163868_c0_seq8:10-324(+)
MGGGEVVGHHDLPHEVYHTCYGSSGPVLGQHSANSEQETIDEVSLSALASGGLKCLVPSLLAVAALLIALSGTMRRVAGRPKSPLPSPSGPPEIRCGLLRLERE